MKGKANEPVIPERKIVKTFTNSAGHVYQVKGLSPLLPEKIRASIQKRLEAEGMSFEVPTYTVKTAAGETEIHEHNPTTLIVEGDAEQTKQNQDAWDAYILAKDRLESEHNASLMKAILLSVDAQPTKEWREEKQFVGYDVPTAGTIEERYEYIETEVIHSPQDLSGLMMAVFSLSGLVSPEALETVEATFQHQMEQAFAEAGIQPVAEGEVGR